MVVTTALTCSAFAEFQANTYAPQDQDSAAIAIAPDGNFIVVWESYDQKGPGQDANSNGIYGQRFDANGTPLGGEFLINTTTIGNQTEPEVAVDQAGNFVVVWYGPGPDKEDVYARLFDANGQAKGPEFMVNTTTYSRQLNASVAMTASGRFVIVWQSEFLGGYPTDAWEIYARTYEANGQPDGNQFQISILLQCYYPDVAMDGAGNFTVVWMQDDSYHSYNLITARMYNADGTIKTITPLEINTTEFYAISKPSIAAAGNGHFVVTWYGHPDSANLNDIYARAYKFDGTAMSDEFRVNTTLAGAQQYPRVAVNNDREFIIVWNSETEPDSNQRDIFAQRYDEFYRPVGDEFRVNTYVVEDQKYPDVAIRDDGSFITVWQSYDQDGSEDGVFGEFGPKIATADFTCDELVNFRDLCILADEWCQRDNPLKTDLIDDNIINGRDLYVFTEQWLMPRWPCSKLDIYTDGKIDFKDYALWSEGWLQEGPLDGDITGNGTVDGVDLRALVFHWANDCE
jgi:hypothetical protein